MSEKILVVEDESAIADNITYALSTEGFVPLWCQTGEEAMQRLEHEKIALIILDVGLPDINGFDLFRSIRRRSTVPVIFLTARSDEIDRVAGLEMGADDYVVKPFSPRELSARVRAILRRSCASGGSTEKEACPGPFSLDEKRHRISYHDRILELSRYEYRILRILIKSPGRVYSREHLMQLAWEDPEMSLERTVDAHMKTIRKKLQEVCPDESPIVTHRGVGYSLREFSR